MLLFRALVHLYKNSRLKVRLREENAMEMSYLGNDSLKLKLIGSPNPTIETQRSNKRYIESVRVAFGFQKLQQLYRVSL